ncbi:MAG TPA: caspase family protein [Treponemataceae bacterium]|nr:caspase family protein [Treponemataceae bacterium]
MKLRTYTGLLSFFAMIALGAPVSAKPAPANEQLPIERYALYVASNNGGKGREILKYAGSDAVRLSKTMTEVGGVKFGNSLLLSDPTKQDIEDAFDAFNDTIQRNKAKARRTEFIFYYSGHSDERSFLLGNERFDYTELKTAIDNIPSDVHVVMLDSCYSGNFVRAKGGSRQKSFLMDDTTIVQGHAYLSSSSEHEASQESDAIQASYFTHALVTGLRGAADTSGDSRVSLNELYHYAFNETLLNTELTAVGPQHPSYNITLVGSGDLVLTDIAEAEAVLFIPEESEGRYFIRDSNGILVSELNKIRGAAISLALPSNIYSIVVVTPKATLQGTITLNRGERISIGTDTFGAVPKVYGRARGSVEDMSLEAEADRARQRAIEAAEAAKAEKAGKSDAEDESAAADDSDATRENASISDDSPVRYRFFQIGFVPGLAFPFKAKNVLFSVNAFGGLNTNIGALQANGFMGIIKNDLRGIQASGFMNTVSGDVSGGQAAGFMNFGRHNVEGFQGAGFMNFAGDLGGIQAAGFMNFAGDVGGVQAAGFMNVAKKVGGGQVAGFINIAGNVEGIQVGVINIAKSNKGASIGLLNFIADGIMSPAIYLDSNSYLCLQYQGGTNAFYTTFMAGINTAQFTKWDYTRVVFGAGIGTRVQLIPAFSIDLEALWKSYVDFSQDPTKFTTYEYPEFSIQYNGGIQYAQVPELRATLNFSIAKHLSVFASVNVDGRIAGFNDLAFERDEYKTGSYTIGKTPVTLYPTFSLGIKF